MFKILHDLFVGLMDKAATTMLKNGLSRSIQIRKKDNEKLVIG